jgi:hypothetical protein
MNSPETQFPQAPLDPMRGGDALAGVVRAQARMMDALLRQNIETLDFLRKRFELDRQMLADLSRATDPATMISVLSTFWSRAMADYTNEAGTLSSFAAATAGQFIEGLKDEAKALSGGSARTKP